MGFSHFGDRKAISHSLMMIIITTIKNAHLGLFFLLELYWQLYISQPVIGPDMMIIMRNEILTSELQRMSSIPDLAPEGFSATDRGDQ